MSVHTDDAGVSVVSVISSMVEVSDGDERCELIKGGIGVPRSCWPHSFAVSSTNAYENWGHVSSFTSGSLIFSLSGPLPLNWHAFHFAAGPPPFDAFGELDAMDILEVEFHF